MKNNLRSALLIFAASFLLKGAVPAIAMDPFELAKEKRDDLKLIAFVTASAVIGHLGDEKGREKALGLMKNLGITKVYLDVYRDGVTPSPELLAEARDFFRANGLEAEAAITTTGAEGFGVRSPTNRLWMCWNYEETREAQGKLVERAASLFNELIVDDFFATECRCPECAAEKGARTWREYFRDVMVEASEKAIVGPAKRVNPDMTVIIKYPQWYDRFHAFGYDPARQPGIFDLVWVGTETRDPKIERVPQYQAFDNFTWLRSIGGEKTRGGWFDHGNCYPEIYMEQAYQTVLAGASEIVLFSYSPETYANENSKRFTEKLPELFQIASAVKGLKRIGIAAYKPPNSDPGHDHYIYDFLGMLGLPVVMTADFPENARVLALSQHALADPDIKTKLSAHLDRGGSVVLTARFLEEIKTDAGLISRLGLEGVEMKPVIRRIAEEFRLENGETVKSKGMVDLAAKMRPGRAARPLGDAVIGGALTPVAFVADTAGGGSAVVLNLSTYEETEDSHNVLVGMPVFFQNLPDGIVNAVRREAVKPLGARLDAPVDVGLYLMENKIVAVENFRDEEAPATLTFDAKLYGAAPRALTDVVTGETFPVMSGSAQFSIPARTLRVLRIAGTF